LALILHLIPNGGVHMREFRASDINKTKSQLLKEIAKLRQRIIELEKAEIKRRKAEEALRESEEKYRATFESTGTATTIVEEDTTISLVNSEFEKLSGYSKEEIEGKKSWTEFVVKDDLEKMKEYHRLRRIDEKLAPRNYEFRFIDRYGRIKNILITISMIPGTKKSVASLLDITEHKQREKELKILFQLASLLNSGLDLEETLEKIVDTINEVLGFNYCSIRLVDKERNVLVTKVIRGVGEEYWKYRKEVPIGKHDYDLSGLTALKGKPHYVRDLMTLNFPKEVKENLIKKFNLKSYLCIPIKVKNEVLGVLSIMTQEYKEFSENEMRLLITFTELAGQAILRAHLYDLLKKSEEKYRTLIETSSDGIISMDEKGKIMFWNKAAQKMFGYSKEEIIGKPVTILIPEEYREEHIAGVRKILEEKGHLKGTLEVEGLKKNGERFPIEFSYSIYRNNDTATFIAIIRDIIERKKMEEKLRKSEKVYKSLFEFNKSVLENSPAGIAKLNNKMRIVYVNMEFRRLIGEFSGKVSKIIGLNIKEIPVLNKIGTPDVLNKLSKGKKISGETSFISAKGKRIYISFSGVPIFEENKFKGAILLLNDITDRKLLEQQLLQAQKMESIGRLAGGIAHDFNNLLTSIIGYAEMAQMKISPKEPSYNCIKQILNASERAKILIEKILTFSRKVVTQQKIINLNSLIENFKDMLERILGEDIELKFILEKELGNIKADPHQIEQIIMNLAVNSRDAMPKGGKLIIETKNIEFNLDNIKRPPSLVPGKYILLSVTDTGYGIDDKILPHIFEPFFTTKKKGMGTGLGLSTVYGIVKQSNGHIEVESQVGKGTTIKIYFPKVEEKIKKTTTHKISLSKFFSGKGTILIVEDEGSVRELIVNILSQHGYETLSAKNENEALSIWEKHKKKINLVLTDIVIPGTNGWELTKKLIKSNPKLKVLYMTGYAEDIISKYMASEKNIPILQKPFTPNELLIKIREIMSS
jgi:PAS domain S-box-containing protein